MAGLEFAENPVTFASGTVVSQMIKVYKLKDPLFLVTMNGECWPTVLTKVFRNVVCDPLSADKNENLGVLSADDIKMFDQLGAFLKVAADFDDLSNVMIRCELHRTNINLDKVFQEILAENCQIDQNKDLKEHTVARRCTSFGQVAENMSV